MPSCHWTLPLAVMPFMLFGSLVLLYICKDLVTKSITWVSGASPSLPFSLLLLPRWDSLMRDRWVCEADCLWCNDAVTPGRDLGHFNCTQSHEPCKDSLPTQSICTMLSWNLRMKHILPVVLQAFHPMRQRSACSITLVGLDQQWQLFSCIAGAFSSSYTCWPSSQRSYQYGCTFAWLR